MRFHGLPEDTNIGAMDVTSRDVNDLLRFKEWTCMSCNRVSVSYFKAKCGHILCTSCILFSPTATEANAWCPLCRIMVTALSERIPTSTLDSFTLICDCGYEGSLTSIRNHILRDNIPHQPLRNVSQAETSPIVTTYGQADPGVATALSEIKKLLRERLSENISDSEDKRENEPGLEPGQNRLRRLATVGDIRNVQDKLHVMEMKIDQQTPRWQTFFLKGVVVAIMFALFISLFRRDGQRNTTPSTFSQV